MNRRRQASSPIAARRSPATKRPDRCSCSTSSSGPRAASPTTPGLGRRPPPSLNKLNKLNKEPDMALDPDVQLLLQTMEQNGSGSICDIGVEQSREFIEVFG